VGTKKKAKRKIILAVGHPWYSGWRDGGYTSLQLTRKPVASSLLLRGGEELCPLKHGDTGNYNKVRLVMEILE
jgi:hypothetical protein